MRVVVMIAKSGEYPEAVSAEGNRFNIGTRGLLDAERFFVFRALGVPSVPYSILGVSRKMKSM